MVSGFLLLIGGLTGGLSPPFPSIEAGEAGFTGSHLPRDTVLWRPLALRDLQLFDPLGDPSVSPFLSLLHRRTLMSETEDSDRLVRMGFRGLSTTEDVSLGRLPPLPFPLGGRETAVGPEPPLLFPSRRAIRPEVSADPVPVEQVPTAPQDTFPAAIDTVGTQDIPLLFDSDFAQLGVRFRSRGEFGGDWTRFRPCELGLQRTCDPGLFPRLKPDVQFGLQVAGTISERIHVDVDYEDSREFAARNNINVYYEGLEGEMVRRVEIGDVTLGLPESRFLTQAIPAGNFGFRALTDLGPLDIETVWAQQNGDISAREFQLSGVGGRQAFIQEDTLVLDDADYVRGQFFFLVDPTEIVGYPHIDVLALTPSDGPPDLAPGSEPVQLYRFENDPVTRQQVEGYIQADAEAEGTGVTVRESGWFRYLRPGVDYFLHPSGLWLALRRPLRQDEMLGTTYVTSVGDTIGDYNPERLHNSGVRPTLRLLKASGPKHQPGTPTWDLEMHQVYRISGSDDVESSSVALTLSLGELSAGRTFKRRVTGEEITLLKLLGLDEESPVDQLDPAFVYRPAQDFFQDVPPVSGTFIVFPTLRPFQAPPPLRSIGLSAEETAVILGLDANRTIYESVDPVERENGGLYRLNIPFRIRSEGVISSFSLGALGIRDGSERVYFGERLLRAGEDYTIDYEVGQVTLTRPEALFSSDPNARVRATWEQKALFQIAPTSIFGFNARYGLGDRGELNFTGLYQQEKTLQNRPQLGMEPASILLGGVNGQLTLGAPWLDGALARLPGVGPDSLAALRVQGEMALSLPNPNTEEDVYLDDFDVTDEQPLSLLASDWFLGSVPGDPEGVEGILPAMTGGANAGGLVWQHTWILEGPGGDSLGVFEGFFPRRDIDQQINIAGNETRQVGLRLSFDASTAGPPGEGAWRSLTTTLSNTGTDLTRRDFLEFYAYAVGGGPATLILDLGRVSEDALFVDDDGQTSGSVPDTGEPWGLGFLDEEADPRQGEIWNDLLDQRGAWVESCVGSRGAVFPLGDPRANCTRGNGRNDTEDLDGDGNLSTDDRVYRYVVPLGQSSPYLARTSAETGTSFQLYRIPLRGPNALNVGGQVTEADWRAVKHLRMTVVGTQGQGISLARLRILGSRWVKRGVEGVVEGLAGDVNGLGGKVEVGPVSRLSEGTAYEPPPGVLEELDDPSQAFSGRGIEFNEKSLQVSFSELAPGDRAEVYSRFPQRPRNFLTYRQARLWVVGRDGDWGDDGVEFFVKAGSDSENFYLYKTSRPPSRGGSGVAAADWLPEVVVDFQQWLDLRRQAEEELIQNPPTPGGPPLAVWSADSTYAVFLKDRARAPNLAAVRELSVGVWNSGAVPARGSLWINELRLSNAVQDPGYAGYLNVDLEASGFFSTSLSYSGRGPFFRQLSGDPTYQDDAALALRSTLELGRVAPESWGVSVPVAVTHTRLSQDPTFLAQSDVRVDRLDGLRETGTTETRVEVGFHKATPVGNPVIDPVLEGLRLRAGYSKSRTTTTTLDSDGSGLDARADYSHEPQARDFALVPAFAQGLVRSLLPRGLEESVLGARLRWTPEQIRLGSLYYRRDRTSFRYEQILRLADDRFVTPTLAPREALETTANLSFRPFGPLGAEISFFSVRDLLPPEQAVQDTLLQPLLERERWHPGFVDLGWEIARNLRTRLDFRPSLAAWLRTDFSLATDYTSDRNAQLVGLVPMVGDTLLALQRNANGSRTTRATAALELATLAQALWPSATQEGSGGWMSRLLQAFDPFFLTRQGGLNSRFNREPVDPGAGFQLGWGGRDAFRVLQADTASILTDRTLWTAGGGVRLPLNLRLAGNYSDSRIRILHRRSDRELTNRAWPDLRLTLSEVALPEGVRGVLKTVSVNTGVRRNYQENTFGGSGLQRRSREEWQIPVDVNLTWGGDISTRYRATFTNGDGMDPTGDTENRRRTHSILVSSSLANPPILGPRIDGPLRMTLAFQHSSDADCRIPAEQAACIPFVDFENQSVNLTLDTTILPMEVGLHLTYVSRQSSVGRRDGSTQFQLGLFGQFVFNSGTFSPSF